MKPVPTHTFHYKVHRIRTSASLVQDLLAEHNKENKIMFAQKESMKSGHRYKVILLNIVWKK